MTPTDHDRRNGRKRAGASGVRRGLPRPLILTTAAALLASGGLGAAAASAATPPPPQSPPPQSPAPTGTATEAPTGTPAPTGSSTASPTGSPTAPGTPLPPAPAPVPVPALPTVHPLEFAGAVHGEFLVGTEDPCVFTTVFAQTGQVTAVADDSLAVRSADGFEQVYALTDDTRVVAGRRGDRPVRQDDWVVLTATREGDSATAAYVYDLSRPVRKHRRGWWYQRQWPPGAVKWRTPAPCPTPPQTPVPTASATPTAMPTATPTVPPEATPTATATPTDPPPAPGGTPTATPAP
ncbi:hypothetical protein Ppa06_47790 [Planomonospora parontospora subsp. parontospora]|uniref:Uncharacterized protein n=2 Tax=Planomonospora parontospora TaxID=58119 RepID=A0AA37BJZ6_9ACTN|nr:hypothetical protein [Planomonospora parontospora]GGK82105.1 hypothetical protein GCM10010126_46810 [Planomonospora parontospora]GII10981.1 hypothetical protein Ppa06_47790 [Planomonospora parontospora subsp. parontospora]